MRSHLKTDSLLLLIHTILAESQFAQHHTFQQISLVKLKYTSVV
jgi:hypothetical protein